MTYDITGKVMELKEVQTFPSGFCKRELIIEVEDEKYPQTISLEWLNDNIDKLDDINVGDVVKVTFDLRGRETKGRVYNSLVGWKIQVESKAEVAAPVADPDDIPF